MRRANAAVAADADAKSVARRRVMLVAGALLLCGVLAALASVSSGTPATGSAGVIGLVVAPSGGAPRESEDAEADAREDEYLEAVESAADGDDNPDPDEVSAKKKNAQLWDSEEERVMREAALEELIATGPDAEFDLFKKPKRERLVFIKLNKVGGTSVASAMRNAALTYGMSIGPNMRKPATMKCTSGNKKRYDIFYMHAKRRPFLEKCLPGAGYVTIMREPVSRLVSFRTWATNRDYFIHYPDRECDYTGPNPDAPPADGQHTCSDDSYRHKLTLERLLADTKRRSDSARPRCGEACYSVTRSGTRDAGATITALKNEYMLAGVTEHLDSMLVILALRQGWSLNSIVYDKCKDQHGTKVSTRDLTSPENKWAYEKLRRETAEDRKVYDFVKQRYEAYLDRLGPGFAKLLQRFKDKVKAHNETTFAKRNGSKRWVMHPQVLYC